MFTRWKREREIRLVLKRLAKQRVVTILQAGNVWVIEHAVSEKDDDVAAALRTCHMRGWVEVLEEAVPEAEFNPNNPPRPPIGGVAPLYRLTASGWNALNRSHAWVISTFVVVSGTFIATLIRIATGA